MSEDSVITENDVSRVGICYMRRWAELLGNEKMRRNEEF